MAYNIRNDTRNKQHNFYNVGNNVTTSDLAFKDISSSPSCHLENEAIDYLENPHQMKKTIIERDDLDYADNLSDEDEIYWDNNVVDLLQVECNEDLSDGMELSADASTNTRNKIYPIEKYCAICNKEFSVQRDLAKHAQQMHLGEKGFKCQHCPTLFSKLKSVTAHFNRTHSKRRFYSEPSIRSANRRVENNQSMGNSLNADDIFANRKGKIYPIENICAVCDMKVSFQRDLVKHTQEAHPNEKVFKCLYCPTLFSKLKSVTSHYKRSHSNFKKTIACEFCNKTFFTQFLLERHRRSHTEQRPYVCNQCRKTYKYKRNLLVHMKTHSKDVTSLNTNIDEDYMDEYCENDDENEYTGDEDCVNEEQNLLTGDGYSELNNEEDGIIISGFSSSEINSLCRDYPFKCDECNKVYKYKKNLKSHEKTHHRNNDQISDEIETITLDDTSENEQDNININNSTYFIIDELNTDSEHFEDLGENEFATNFSDEYDHEDYVPVTTQIATDNKQNECGICMKAFKCQQAVAKHLQRCHAEIEFFKCPYCDDNFYSLDSLSLHITIRKHYQKRNVCAMCLKSFDRKSDLKRHVRTHTDERPYSCNVCNKKFKQSNHLKRHTELNHDTAIKTLKYSCHICMKSFLLKETLKRHMVIHEREKQFPCSMCSKVFKTRYDFQRHQETHSSRKNLTCEFCLQTFGDVETLNLHIRGHTGDRKYICTICEKTFKEKSHLVNHRKSHTNV